MVLFMAHTSLRSCPKNCATQHCPTCNLDASAALHMDSVIKPPRPVSCVQPCNQRRVDPGSLLSRCQWCQAVDITNGNGCLHNHGNDHAEIGALTAEVHLKLTRVCLSAPVLLSRNCIGAVPDNCSLNTECRRTGCLASQCNFFTSVDESASPFAAETVGRGCFCEHRIQLEVR